MFKDIIDEELISFDETLFLELDESEELIDLDKNQNLPDTLKMYLNNARKFSLLSVEEEKQLGIVLKNVKNCVLLNTEESLKNELNYDLVINNLILCRDNPKIVNLIKQILTFIRKKPNSKIKIIENILSEQNNHYSLVGTPTLLETEVFEKNLKIYLNYLIAKEKMINSNLRLVISFAKKYANYKISLNDLINEGNVGLIIATENYDVDKGFRFSTYASWWIRQSILRHIYSNSIDISVTEGKFRDALKFRKKVEELEKITRKKYTYEELAKILNIDYKKIIEFMYINHSISLEAPLSHDEDNDATLGDIVACSDDPIENLIFKEDLRNELECLFTGLTEQERKVIYLRFGLNDESEKTYTFEAIGKMLHVSKERIRFVEAKALMKMKRNARTNPKAKQLELYLTN